MRVSRRKKRPSAPKERFFANEAIRVPRVRVIDEQGQNLEVLPTADAVRLARGRGFDLVLINPKADPPVTKFVDFGHFKYQKEKERRKARAQSKTTEVKGVRLTPRIGEHDFEVRLNQAQKFLERGDKVQIEIIMRGRDRIHPHLITKKIEHFIVRLAEMMPLRTEQPLTRQGTKFIALVAKQ